MTYRLDKWNADLETWRISHFVRDVDLAERAAAKLIEKGSPCVRVTLVTYHPVLKGKRGRVLNLLTFPSSMQAADHAKTAYRDAHGLGPKGYVDPTMVGYEAVEGESHIHGALPTIITDVDAAHATIRAVLDDDPFAGFE